MTKNTSPAITLSYDSIQIESANIAPAPQAGHPYITSVRPRNGSTGVQRDAFVATDVSLPTSGAGVDASTLAENVHLYRTSDHQLIPGVSNTSGGGDAIVFQPSQILDPNTDRKSTRLNSSHTVISYA